MSSLETIQQIKRQTHDLLHDRSGHFILDVGCGTGDDVRALAVRVGASGRVVGIDCSSTMIVEVRQRSAGQELPVEFRIGDSDQLEFPDRPLTEQRALEGHRPLHVLHGQSHVDVAFSLELHGRFVLQGSVPLVGGFRIGWLPAFPTIQMQRAGKRRRESDPVQ